MNSDRAAAVRDSINGCPSVIDDDAIVERDGDPWPTIPTDPDREGDVLTGDRMTTYRYRYRPAYVHQSGTVGNGDGATRPVFVVILEPLWTEAGTGVALSLPKEMVYEAAKNSCGLRYYPEDHRHGEAVWVVDHFSEDLTNTDGDRCRDCEGTYYKMDDGTPTCARCGTTPEPYADGEKEVTVSLDDFIQ